jgi:osmotically-inducible protein OsmY
MLRYVLAAGLGAGLGAGLEYFMDPDRGRRRRNMARDRAAALARRASSTAQRKGRYAASTARGLTDRMAYSKKGETAPDDATLAHRVESEIFRDPDVPKGDINVNVEDHVVVLRGKIDSPEEMSALEKKVREIPGVYDVRNMLHV